jgi:hypothetical protein
MSTSALGPPPRSYSLRNLSDAANPSASQRLSGTLLPSAGGYDEEDDGIDSTELVTEANEAVRRVEDGWSASELLAVTRKLVNRVEQLVRLLSIFNFPSRRMIAWYIHYPDWSAYTITRSAD